MLSRCNMIAFTMQYDSFYCKLRKLYILNVVLNFRNGVIAIIDGKKEMNYHNSNFACTPLGRAASLVEELVKGQYRLLVSSGEVEYVISHPR